MSEEKIIEILKKLISWKSMKVEIRDYEIDAIQDLLDLYNKEKEKNASLQKEIKLMKSININDNYISKDKIRKQIRQLEALDKQYYKKVIVTLKKMLGE